MSALLQQFIAETRDLLETASRQLLELEKNPSDKAAINGLFRTVHTIKGASGLFDIRAFTSAVHAGEDLLDQVREGIVELKTDSVDQFFELLDQVGIWLDELEAVGELGVDAALRGKTLSEAFRSELIATDSSQATPAKAPSQSAIANASKDAALDDEDVSLSHETFETLKLIADVRRSEAFEFAVRTKQQLLLITYTPSAQCFFTGTDPFFTIRQIDNVFWRKVTHGTSGNACQNEETFDPFNCDISFQLLCANDRPAIEHLLRYVGDECCIESISPNDLIIPVGDPMETELHQNFVDQAKTAIGDKDLDALKRYAGAITRISSSESLQGSAILWMEKVLENLEADFELLSNLLSVVETGIEPEVPMTTSEDVSSYASVSDTVKGQEPLEGKTEVAVAVDTADAPIDDQGAATDATSDVALHPLASGHPLSVHLLEDIKFGLSLLAADAPIWDGVIASTEVALRRIFARMQIADMDDAIANAFADAKSSGSPVEIIKLINTALSAKPQSATDDAERNSEEAASLEPETAAFKSTKKQNVLRVEQARVDRLMDLAGELVVAKNALPFLAQRAQDVYGVRALGREIKSQFEVIDRIADDLQTAVMQVRMIPVNHVFQRFPRLVRDISRKLDKKVKLIVAGEETEIDKNIVEDLAEPLVHLVRNSLDHGIETPKTRENTGKPVEATLHISATPLDDRVMIEVTDDGKGIDPKLIRAKAIEKGLIDAEQVLQMSDSEVLNLVMAPGFSTAEKISDLSGRGVGMDVVRTMVEANGGTISLESELGKGTTARIFLPLSATVTRIMLIDVANTKFGVSIDNIVETVKVPINEIRLVRDREAVILRNRLIPLIRLAERLELNSAKVDCPKEEAVLVVRVGHEEVGLVVDRFQAGVDILLKPMEGILANFRLYSGTAVMGDGSVLLVLNLEEVVKCL